VKKVFIKDKIVLNDILFNIADFTNIYVVAFGKASFGMISSVCDHVNITKGVMITNDATIKSPSKKIDVVIGGHPTPNINSIEGADKVINIINQCNKNDLLLVLISGGGSALLCKPRVSLTDFQEITRLLLKSGADITEINTIRKHLSYVKGGQLIQRAQSIVISLIISDIVNDPIEFISSGPTCPDSTTFLDAKQILEKYHLWDKIPGTVKSIIVDGINEKITETPKKGNPIFNNIYNFIVANNVIACWAAAKKAKTMGYKTQLLTTSVTGEVKQVSEQILGKVCKQTKNQIIMISGGEPTVTIKGNGKGGRNQEFVLNGVKQISNSDIVIASFATDGIDGNSDAAGAIADGFTDLRAKNKNLNPDSYLEDNNSYIFFSELNDLLITGPTGTNVMDIQLIIT
jgi:glycerate-2-kinase